MMPSAPATGVSATALGGTPPGSSASAPAGYDPRAAELLRRLELDVTRRLDGILHGEFQGLVPGHGSEPGEARAYQPGDDVRRIDWNVTARMTDAHIRETIADRELETWLVVDRSASLDFGTHTWEKRDLVLAASAGVGFLTNRGGNRVGAVIAERDTISAIPSRQGRKHLLGILSRIQATERQATPTSRQGSAGLTTEAILRRAGATARRRGLLVVISDWLDEPETWRHALTALSMRHQVLCIEVLDPRELDLPNVGVLSLVDTESGRTRDVDTSSRALRERYAAAATDQRAAIAAAMMAAGAGHLRLRTDEDWLMALARFVSTKRSRLASNVRSTQ